MEIKISNKTKKELFIALFHVLKTTSASHCNIQLLNGRFHIQGMDVSHICLFEINLHSSWFDTYQIDTPQNICFHTGCFYSMISAKSDDQSLTMKLKNQDNLLIEFENINNTKSSDYNKYYVLPLMDYDYEEMDIPETEYDVDFSMPSKNITDIMSQLATFGDNVRIICSDTCVDFKTNGTTGEMRVNVLVDNLTSYAIVENEKIELTYSLNYINKMCMTNKLTKDIDFSLSNNYPMKITYQIDTTNQDNKLVFYIAPKIEDDD